MVAAHPAPHLRPFKAGPAFGGNSLQFELVESTDLLRLAFASAVGACANALRLAQSILGLIPPNSVLDKFPHYRWAPLEKCVP